MKKKLLSVLVAISAIGLFYCFDFPVAEDAGTTKKNVTDVVYGAVEGMEVPKTPKGYRSES